MTAHSCPTCGDLHHIPETPSGCACGHPELSHHRTPNGRRTRCTIWNPGECICQLYREKQEIFDGLR